MEPALRELTQAVPPQIRRLSWLSLGYLLDSIEISRGGGDIVDRLLVAAILDANLAPVKQDNALQIAYAALEDAPPDELRRPISVNAVAQSLGLPFETVRRRVAGLARSGALVVAPGGVLVPPAAIASPAFKAMSLARYQRLRRFHAELKAADALPVLDPGGEPLALPPGDPPVRIANRLLAEHLMRFIESATRRVRHPLSALTLLHIVRGNTEQASLAELESAFSGVGVPMRPVTIATLASRLNVPGETLRRRTAELVRAGFCRRDRQGVFVRPEMLATDAMSGLVPENAANMQRLFSRLERFGVLAAWDREDAAGAR